MYSKVIPKKRFGQNFLIDEKVVADLVAAADLPEADMATKADVVIEIGAGTGVVTKELAKQAGKVFAFEIDSDLIPVQRSRLLNYKNVEIINKDFLKVNNQILSNTSALCSAEVFSDFKIVGSIPYQITSPLIHKLLTFDPRPSLVVLLIQKEVAEKIAARPPKATYLSNIVKLLGEVEMIRLVPKTAFWPAPKVDGAIIKIVCSCPDVHRGPFEVDIEKFQKFLHRGFQHPRKMLRTKFDVADLESCGIAPTRRAQTLELEEWFRLYTKILNSKSSAPRRFAFGESKVPNKHQIHPLRGDRLAI